MSEYIDTNSEEWRHECEARHVLALRRQDRNAAHDYLALVAKRRGRAAADALRDAAAKLWSESHGD